MGVNSPESYFEKFKSNGEDYGVINCYDGHSIDARTLKQMNENGFKEFYNISDGCYTEHYVICSHKELTQTQLKKLDEELAEANNG